MPVVPFPARSRLAPIACDVTIGQAGRTRRYHLWAESPGRVRLEVWFGRALHRTARASGRFAAQRLQHQVDREVRDLLADGWIAVESSGLQAVDASADRQRGT
jgi:hypothetical protein